MSDKRQKGSLAQGFKWSLGDHSFTGYSVAGITTSLVYENESAVFDIGQGLPFNIPKKNYFLTHAHSDHAGGLAYVLSQRSLWSLEAAKVYTHPDFIKPLNIILEQWQQIEDYKFKFELLPIRPDDRIPLGKHGFVESFKTYHRITSQGFSYGLKKKKLKKEFSHLSSTEIARLRQQKVSVSEMIEERIFAFTGDTTIEFLEHLKPVQVLFMETTFVDDTKPIEAARKWGHIHLDEWLYNLDDIPADKIVMIHLSARYSTAAIEGILDKKLPKKWREKIEIFPRPF